ncbi:MAG: HAD family phosphatase [Oscillospiraceae bacterium]|nr:HAD family phosphatase [Oscillospiraceae bacterium]
MPDCKLIALDLDGTLLNSAKELTPRSRAALEAAAGAGIHIVPATGRFYRGMPECIRSLPFVRYVISINGAEIYDTKEEKALYSAVIPLPEALEVLTYLDTLPVIYDCYALGWGYMTARMQEAAEEYISYPPSLSMVRELRDPVPELKAYLREKDISPQKLQLFTRDIPLRDKLLGDLAERFPHLVFTASLPNNLEINSREAGKDRALEVLAAQLGISMEETMAFGDGLNDVDMLRASGVGVAMGNAHPAVKQAADLIAEDCDCDGAAKIIETLLREGRGGIL